jgi:hypothetical protein
MIVDRFSIVIRCLLLLLLVVCTCYPAFTQSDTIPSEPLPDLNEQRLEDLLQDADEDSDFELNTAFEDLDLYLKNPINLNKASEEDLRDLNLLSDVQISNLLYYREQMDGFITVYELQAVPGMDLATIKRILPFVGLRTNVDDFQASPKEMIINGDNELYLRWNRVLETQRGYLPRDESVPDSTPYLGDPNQYYVRYRHTYSNRLSMGFTAEKDRGEEFFSGSNKKGFDYYSAHIFLRDYNQRIKAIALGDYSANFGQGLVLFTGFGYSKSSLVTSVRRGGRALKQYTSVNEANFLRGAATTIALSEKLELTALVSWRQRDGNLLFSLDTLDNEEVGAFTEFSSLNLSGFHRTRTEVEDRNGIQFFTTGASIKYTGTKGHVAFNSLYNKLDKALTLSPRVYNRFYFQGNELTNLSVDYSYRWRNLTFFGETATSDNGAIATINGLLTTLDQNVNLAVVQRSYPRDYQAIFGNPFGETVGGRNEQGLYIGMEVFPAKQWIISGYYDAWRHPWLRSTVDAPSRGHEYRLRLTYFQKRKLELFLELRNEIKEVNVRPIDSNIDQVVPQTRFQTRLHCAYQFSKAFEWRSRVDWGYTDNPINNIQKGFSFYQDLFYRPEGSPFIISSRFALFDTDGYQVRFYNYENGLLYNFRITPYYNQGSRYYFNIRYKGMRNVTLEARYARLFWANQDSIGSGNESTGEPTRTDVGVQIKIKF